MKQILQNLKTGNTEIVEVPQPQVKPGHVLIRTHRTLISAGTERMLVEFGKANFLNKARQQPDKVKMVLDKIKTDGLLPTIESVLHKLDTALPMGYCNVGEVIALGAGVTEFQIGDFVVSNGHHAEYVVVPKNLCVALPANVALEVAPFAILSAIALQGIRLAEPTLGETVAVIGLGLLGLIAVQLLRAQGCRVLGIDYDASRLALAKQFGAEIADLSQDQDPLAVAENFSKGRGIDAVLITAATQSNEPVQQAAQMCRKRGRIVLVGVAGLELSRADFYEKELSFQVSCSYGPGRYDKNYEELGHDYPFGFVRWTEQRNIEAVLDLIANQSLNLEPLITHRFSIDAATQAYDLISTKQPSLGIVLEYAPNNLPNANPYHTSLKVLPNTTKHERKTEGNLTAKIGFIGAGNYATQILIPAFKKTAAEFISIASQTGVSGFQAARKHQIPHTTTDTQSLFEHTEINTLVITTQHNSHAKLTCSALQAGKHVFVEKPLALTQTEIANIKTTYQTVQQAQPCHLMVGFNRRFAPQIIKIKSLLAPLLEPKTIIITVNAGMIPADHWTQDKQRGGGRIIGEACHFIDLLRHLIDAPITHATATQIGRTTTTTAIREDKATITLQFADGSFGTIHYLANGHKSFPKERVEIFCAGKILQLDNFKKLIGYGWPKFKKMNLWRQNKGQIACANAFVNSIQNHTATPIPFDELIEVAEITLKIAEELRQCD